MCNDIARTLGFVGCLLYSVSGWIFHFNTDNVVSIHFIADLPWQCDFFAKFVCIVIESRRGIRQMAHILDRMMLTLQAQSRTKLFSSKTIWLSKLETVRRWRTLLKVMKVPQVTKNSISILDRSCSGNGFWRKMIYVYMSASAVTD